MNKLFITTKDRPVELTILCKSLLHSDMRNYINEVIFLDDNSEDTVEMQRIYSAFSYMVMSMGIRTRFIEAKDGRSGINDSWDRMKYYPSEFMWMLNGDMMVFPKYFSTCMGVYNQQAKANTKKSIIVSGFNTRFHPQIRRINTTSFTHIETKSVGGCSLLVHFKDLDNILECLGKPTMSRGWDLHLGEVFDGIYVTNPSQSQHLGIHSGLNQVSLAGFPGAFADIGVAQ